MPEITEEAEQADAGAAPSPSECENGLEAVDLAIVEMEGRRFKYQGAKERAIRAELGIPVTAYYQRLNLMIDLPGAWAQQPALMRRLRDHRDSG